MKRFIVIIIICTALLLNSVFLVSAPKKKKRRGGPITPEFPSALKWVNTTESLSLAKLKGHVVLLTFWSYSSIHCRQILPDLEFLARKYKDQPFVIIGIHSGRFFNENDPDNVRAAVQRYHISFPVVVDYKYMLRKRYCVKAMPTYVMLDSTRVGVAAFSGKNRKNSLDQLIGKSLELGKKKKTLALQKYAFKTLLKKKTRLSFPTRLAIDSKKNYLYISDTNHHQLVQTELVSGNQAKIVKRIGSGQKGLQDGDLATARFSNPRGICLHNEVLYVADTGNHAIRAVNLHEKKVTTLAGDGTNGEFGKPNFPMDIEVFEDTLYISMAGSNQLWTLDLGANEMELYVGNGYEAFMDGSALGSSLSQPSGLTMDTKGKRLFFTGLEASALRVVNLEDGKVKTLIGKGLMKYGFVDGKLSEASLQRPQGIFYSDEKIYIADTFNHAFRTVDLEKEEIRTMIMRKTDQNNVTDRNKCNVFGTIFDILPLNEPNDVLLHNDFIYFADTNNHLIRVYNIKDNKLENVALELSQ